MPGSRYVPRLLHFGLALFVALLAFTALSVRDELEARAGRSRAAALFDLVQGRTPIRPTDTPGANAWLDRQLRRYQRFVDDPEMARLYAEIAAGPDTAAPPVFAEIVAALRAGSDAVGPVAEELALVAPDALEGAAPPPMQFRVQQYVEYAGSTLVVTRRSALGGQASSSARFLAATVPRVQQTAATIRSAQEAAPMPSVPATAAPRVARVYALAEDGTLVSRPAASGPGSTQLQAALAEGREFRKVPQLPNFVSNEFFFAFDTARPEADLYYSGLYLDLGGHGVVATVTVPLADATEGEGGILGVDIAFEMDWDHFAERIEAPMIARAVSISEPPSDRWRPWSTFAAAFAPAGSADLDTAVGLLAEREQGEPAAQPTAVVHRPLEEHGAVAAFQVARTTWLLVLFPEVRTSFAWLPVLLVLVVLACLLGGLEVNRRRAETAMFKAERELQEKQNLLNTMRVPLVVVDPNSDEVVHRNAAAGALGIEPGSRIRDFVADDPRAQEHYDRMQVAGQAPRRAYGLPVRVRGADGELESRYAIVRSVAVQAPIEALHADERHRLGIVFLVEPDDDLALLHEELVSETRIDERRRLAGLLSHGVDTLARVLAHYHDGEGPPDVELTRWLAAYIERRVRISAWILDHWDADAPLPPDSSVEVAQARATVDRMLRVFDLARGDADLRSRLHWNNGALSAGSGTVIEVEIDWPDDYWFSVPVRGGFGLLLGEALINAIKHSPAGHRPRLWMAIDRVRHELQVTVENTARGSESGQPSPYGGVRILEQLARLFGWRLDLETGEQYRLELHIPVSERLRRDEID